MEHSPFLTATQRKLCRWLDGALSVAGLNQPQLARALSLATGRPITRGTVCGMLHGRRKISAEELLEISRICDVPVPTPGGKRASVNSKTARAAQNANPEAALSGEAA